MGFQKGGSRGISFLTFYLPSLEPVHVGGGFQHVVTVPSGNWYESNSCWVISYLLDESTYLLLDFFETSLAVWWLGRVHLVNSNNELLYSQSISKKSVFSGLTIWRYQLRIHQHQMQ